MCNLVHITKAMEVAGAFNEQINLFGFSDERGRPHAVGYDAFAHEQEGKQAKYFPTQLCKLHCPCNRYTLTDDFTCQWRIDILTDSAVDRYPDEGWHSCGAHSGAVTRSNQLTSPRLEAQNSKWFHPKCRLPVSAGYHREHYALENQAAMGV